MLKIIVDSFSIPAFLVSRHDYKINYANTALCDILNFNLNDLIGFEQSKITDLPNKSFEKAIQSGHQTINNKNLLSKKSKKKPCNFLIYRHQEFFLVFSYLGSYASTLPFRQIMEALPVMIFYKDKSGRIIYANPEAENQIGKSFHGKTNHDHFEKVIANAMDTRDRSVTGFEKVEKDIIDKFNTPKGIKWTKSENNPVVDEKGKIIGFAGYAIDITDRINAYKEIQKKENKYKTLFDNAPLAYQSLNESGHIIDVNPKWLEIFEYKEKSNVIGKWFGNFLHNDSIEDFKTNFSIFKKYGYIRGARLRIQKKSGHYADVSFEGQIGYNSDGSIRQTYCTFKDITKEAEMEKALLESEERYRILFRENASIMLLINPANGKIVDANNSAVNFYGYTYKQLTSMNINEINTLSEIKIKIEMQRAKEMKKGYFNFIHKLSDGSLSNVEVYSGRVTQSNKILLYSIIHDITERVRTEEEYRKISAVVEQSPSSIIITDYDGKIEYVNPRFTEITQYGRKEVLGKTPAILKSKHTTAEEYKKLWKIIKSGKTWHGVFRNRRKDGSLFWEDATIFPIFNHSGDITHFIGLKIDISKEKRLEQQILQIQRLESVGHLAGGIAHDFNNLLTIIEGNTELIYDLQNGDSQLADHTKAIMDAADRAAKLTRQLLLFSRHETMNIRTLNFNKYIPEIINLVRPQLNSKITFNYRIDSDLFPLECDISNIQQAILNLCINADEAMPKGGQLNLIIENTSINKNESDFIYDSNPGNYIRIQVEDTGVGIPKEEIRQLFDPFYTTKETGKGHGMGLSVVYGIVRKHKGWINVYSEPDHGTVFTIYLPASVYSEQKIGQANNSKILSGNGERILVIEDDHGISNFCRISLEKYGYRVDEADTCKTAAEIFESKNGNYDLILSDVILPDGNGFETALELKKANPSVILIATSGYSEERSNHRKIMDQGYSFIQKPFKIKTLVNTIHKLLTIR